jgi:hypothetical protein
MRTESRGRRQPRTGASLVRRLGESRQRTVEGIPMARTKLNLARAAALVGLLTAGFGASAALAAPHASQPNEPPPTVPGSPGDDCSHGDAGEDCRPDPSENGKDCDDHGNARGNEDHCDQAVTTTPTSTSTTTSTTTTTTTTATTATTTTPSTTTTTTGGGPTPTTPATTTAGPPAATPPAPPAAGAGAEVGSNPPMTKPELQKELAKQAKAVRGTVASRAGNNPGELPFTGFPAWVLAIAGSLLLVTGIALRKAAS